MMLAFLRSACYMLLLVIITPPYAIFTLACFPLSAHARYRVTSTWTRMILFLLQHVCGLRYRLLGAENIPKTPSIVLSKHQSAWETLAFQKIFPPQVWVLKKELLQIPFFGWGLAMTSPIAIDRTAGRSALDQVVEQGQERLKSGFWVVIFPEGTRMPPGKRGSYRIGGAWLATHTNTLVVPVAHNAGEFWARNAFVKKPGIITVSIGKPIDPAGMEANELNAKVEEWIETEVVRISQRQTAINSSTIQTEARNQ
ncbi:1-acyl-sn-glycerol-3-phosphate acyltransferase [Nitrosomonas marina]|uniref:1-acyl-sn-glycerol-3-phosphate acyltransferase n=1 Tax=Nitrosomonas marina TaxID=917 RepID=A0A1I0AGM5_9PROT|nr:lysophospholipid acyltransferase family protein [Nitrosomonas marina]SES93326.1 1-acyl-sn-glycerol-3-phosphate acyltransferase [Nitrosomonas marina]